MDRSFSASSLLDPMLPKWHELLQSWAIDGSISRAAQDALRLDGEPPLLRELVRQWSAGDFSDLPPIELVPDVSLARAAGAYAIGAGTIYLNENWLQFAMDEDVIAVLTEELGHHLDAVLNLEDTPGDEGFVFSFKLMPNARVHHERETRIDGTIDSAINDKIMSLELASAPYSLYASETLDGINTTRLWISGRSLDLSKKTYLITHGWRGYLQPNGFSSYDEMQIYQALIHQSSLFPDDSQVLILDWGEAARDILIIPPYNAAGNILPIAHWTADLLAGISGQITLIGHSLGGFMASEISRYLGGNANVVSLDAPFPYWSYDLDLDTPWPYPHQGSIETASPLSDTSSSSLSLVVIDHGDILTSLAGDNEYSATANVSLLVD